MAKTFTFEIDAKGDWGVGIPAMYDILTVTVDSGDPGGDEDSEEFTDFMCSVLQEWYDTPGVDLLKIEDDNMGLVYERDYKTMDEGYFYEEEA
jgi:hypothetical protein